jgi:hypothetical protein
MLTGFENETYDLTDYELQRVLPAIRSGLLTKQGAGMAVTNKQIVAGLERNRAIKTNEARVRKIINYIRNKNMIPRLIASSKGYYIASSRQEVLDYIESLRGRENAIKQVRVAMEDQLQSFHFA